MSSFKTRALVRLTAGYLKLVYATGKITYTGRRELLYGEETFAVGFWHGDSFCYYPQLHNRGDVIVTTTSWQGDLVENLGIRFGFTPVRLPDASEGDAGLKGIRQMMAAAKGHHICFSMDGPLGPYHIPQQFFLTCAVLAKKRILPVSVEIRRKIQFKKRWDKYTIPLPFARLSFTVHEPLEVSKDRFGELTDTITRIMEGRTQTV